MTLHDRPDGSGQCDYAAEVACRKCGWGYDPPRGQIVSETTASGCKHSGYELREGRCPWCALERIAYERPMDYERARQIVREALGE